MPDRQISSNELLPPAQQQEIDPLCAAFEEQWRGVEQPRMEDFLSKVAVPLAARLLKELVTAGVDLRRSFGERWAVWVMPQVLRD